MNITLLDSYAHFLGWMVMTSGGILLTVTIGFGLGAVIGHAINRLNR